MSLKYEILKRLVKAANIKKQWTGMSTQALLENRRRQRKKPHPRAEGRGT